MSEHRKPGPDEPLPRDPEDQQAMAEDPLSVPLPDGKDEGNPPDTDEAGSAPRGGARDGTVHPGHPAPGEPAD
ncbi:hypothetical protein [Streptomyces sp. NK15101]|uniref:hypothetical protein n=1 Tax=Streptomyces sp. NK15101 TaxID=2873261 RepID=UPI001CED3613|nr:hypothetical protein [Streptomyces sp. NK15101]